MVKWIVVAAAAAVVLVTASAFGVWYTEQPGFCPACHEMGPYKTAWEAGPHSDTSCLSCHVDEGLFAHLRHKPAALKEVWDHFTGNPTFPSYNVEIPDHRCTECHEGAVSVSMPSFSHEQHQGAGECWRCHLTAGHNVTADALSAAGVLNPSAGQPLSTSSGSLLRVDSSAQTLSGHVQVSCGECHDMQKDGCGYCHEAPKDHFEPTPCSECHSPSTAFAVASFTHTDSHRCDACHKAPANHFAGVLCTECHSPKVPFADATFRHPPVGEEHSSTSFPCKDCHPESLTSYSCDKCHPEGIPEDD